MEIGNSTILIINLIGVSCVIGLASLLLFTRKHFKCGIGLSLVILCTTMPIYIYNLCFLRGWFNASACVAPFAYAAGTAFVPALWLLTHQYLNPGDKFLKIRFIHFIPMVFCTVVYGGYIACLPFPERINFLIFKSTHMTGWIECLNVTFILFQTIIYSIIAYIYLRRVNKYIDKNFSETEWTRCLWNSKTSFVAVGIFIVTLLCHHLLKGQNIAFLPLIDVAVLFYFIYQAMMNLQRVDTSFPQTPVMGLKFDKIINSQISLDHQQLEILAGKTVKFLQSSKAYLNPALTIRDVADALGESGTNIAVAIRETRKCDFMDLVNKLRVERAAKALAQDINNEQTIGMLTYQSGFSSKKAFVKTFFAVVGKTPEQFLHSIGRK